jgi:hypothetical protein
VGTVEQHEGLVTDDFEATRRASAPEDGRHQVALERSSEERLGCGQRDRGVVGLVRAVEREQHVR